MAKVVIDTVDAWRMDPVLSRRSITPPRRFERAGVTERVPLTGAPRVIGERISVRCTALEELTGCLRCVNATGISGAAAQAVVELEKEIKVIESPIEPTSGLLVTKYTPAVAAYEAYLPTVTPTRPLHSIESYILADGVPPVLYFTINTDAITVAEGGNVLGVSTDMISVVLTPSAAPSLRTGGSGGSGGGTPKATKLLHPLELEVFKGATDKLLEAGGPRAVVIDIFDKDDATGSIKFDPGTRHPETHAVVLCKQLDAHGNVQIFVIDPSNSDFSKHLAHPALKAFVSEPWVEDGGRGWVDIIADTKRTKIYSVPEGAVTGSEPTQFRDCVDIAVKIANGLNAMTEFPRIDITSVYALPIIQAVSNINRTNEDLLAMHSLVPLRLRQSSDRSISLEIYRLEHKLKAQKDLVRTLRHEDRVLDTEKKHSTILSSGITTATSVALTEALKCLIDDNITKWGFKKESPLALERANATGAVGAI